MSTIVSIVLYAGSLLFAAIIGVEAHKHKHGNQEKIVAGSALVFMVTLFALAATLQVAS